MYKRSKYNIEIGESNDSRILLFNTRTLSYGIMDSETKVIYDSIENYQADDCEDIKKNEKFNSVLDLEMLILRG